MLASASSPLLGIIQGVYYKQVLHAWRQILHEHQEAAARVCPIVKLNCDSALPDSRLITRLKVNYHRHLPAYHTVAMIINCKHAFGVGLLLCSVAACGQAEGLSQSSATT